jgi:hypothetical protein
MTCGEVVPVDDADRCTANSKRTGKRCGKSRCVGLDKCAAHCGLSKAERDRIAAEQQAHKAVITYGLKIETTATEALLDEVQWTAGHVAWLRERVREIEATAVTGDGEGDRNDLVWGTTKVKTGGDDHGTTEEAAPNIWLKLYQTERTHLVKVCSEAIRAGIEERRVKLAEAQGAILVQVIRAILTDLDLNAGQQAKVTEVVPRHLRAVAG